MVHSIKEFFQIKIHHPALTLGDILLRLGHRLVRRPLRTKAVTVFGERRVPLALQNLHHRLLDESIQHCGNAQLAHSPVRLGDFDSLPRLRLSHSATVPESLASAASGSPITRRPSGRRFLDSPCWPSLVLKPAGSSPAHRPLPSTAS